MANILHSRESVTQGECDAGRPIGYGYVRDWNYYADQTP